MIAVVSVHDKKYEPLAEWTLHKNKKEYCKNMGIYSNMPTTVVKRFVVSLLCSHQHLIHIYQLDGVNISYERRV